jgi:hypothetical protein
VCSDTVGADGVGGWGEWVDTVRVGVPAWLYHLATPDRSSPFASAMAARKSSHVTACVCNDGGGERRGGGKTEW